MKNERFERYIYMGVTAILVLIAAVFVVFLFLERNAVFAFLGKVRFVLAPVIYGAVLAFLMSPVYNWCYNTVVYVHDDDKKKEDEEKKIAPKKRFKSESFGNFLGKAVGTVISLAFLIGGRKPFQHDHPAALFQYRGDHQHDASLFPERV